MIERAQGVSVPAEWKRKHNVHIEETGARGSIRGAFAFPRGLMKDQRFSIHTSVWVKRLAASNQEIELEKHQRSDRVQINVRRVDSFNCLTTVDLY